MLRMCMIFPFLLILSSAMAAREEIISPNQVEAVETIGDAEGRACGSCGSSTVTKKPTTIVKPDLNDLLGGHDLLSLIFSGMRSLSVLIFNILGIVLLALLLKNLLSDSSAAAATDPYHYASQSSYADPLTYNKRSSDGSSAWSWQDILESPAATFLTQMVNEAIDKHNVIEKQ